MVPDSTIPIYLAGSPSAIIVSFFVVKKDFCAETIKYGRQIFSGNITLIGCPNLDEGDYTEKLTQIIAGNAIKSVTVVRMEVPCCKGMENAVKRALQASGKFIPWNVITISTDGNVWD